MAQTSPIFDMTQNPFFNPETNPFLDPANNPFSGAALQNIFDGYKLPDLDIDGLLAAQQRNLDAVSAAGKVAAEGVQSIFNRQSETLRGLMEEANGLVKELAVSGTPEEKITRQINLTKSKLEAAAGEIRAISELAMKSQSEAFDILNARFTESLEEIRAVTKSSKPKAKATPKK